MSVLTIYVAGSFKHKHGVHLLGRELRGMHLNFWTVRANLTTMLLAREVSAAARYDAIIKESLQKIAEDQKKYIEYTALFDGDIAAQAKKLIRQIDDISEGMGVIRRNSTKLVAEGKFDEATALFSAEYGPQFRKLAPVYAELVSLTIRSSKENMLDAMPRLGYSFLIQSPVFTVFVIGRECTTRGWMEKDIRMVWEQQSSPCQCALWL